VTEASFLGLFIGIDRYSDSRVPWRMSRAPWNLGGGPVMFRLLRSELGMWV
jgi:hypothetical protein